MGGISGRDRRARTRCIGVDHVAGAIVMGDRAVELTMADHSRWRMTFDAACPALGFYQGFYYRRAVAGHLCASRDAVISRAGGTCPIASIAGSRADPAKVWHERHSPRLVDARTSSSPNGA